MTEYMITIWHEGKRWSEVVGSSNPEVLTRLYKKQYDRFTIQSLNRSMHK